MSITQQRLIGVAGAVAWSCWSDRWWDVLDEDWEDSQVMSISDWEMTGCVPGVPDRPFYKAVDKVALLFRCDGPLWPTLTRVARVLIENAGLRCAERTLAERQIFLEWDKRLYREADQGWQRTPVAMRRSFRGYVARQVKHDGYEDEACKAGD